MKVSLENGFNSLIAYYFKMTNFQFLDEFDLKILVNLANMCGIQLNIDDCKDISAEIFNKFLARMDEVISGTWYRGTVGRCDEENWVYTSEERDFKTIKRLSFYDRFVSEYYSYSEGRNIRCLIPNLLEFLDEIIENDMELLMSRMPKSEVLKKYMTLKKIVLCKTPDNSYFYENIPSNYSYDAFDDWERDIETRGIYPKTYKFIEELEQTILQLNPSLSEENNNESVPKILARVPNA